MNRKSDIILVIMHKARYDIDPTASTTTIEMLFAIKQDLIRTIDDLFNIKDDATCKCDMAVAARYECWDKIDEIDRILLDRYSK